MRRRETAPHYITTRQAAEILGVSVDFLRRDRRSRQPRIPVVRLGPKTFRYRVSQLEDLIERESVPLTGEGRS
jgi:excisionase family DNA binding protein